MTETSGGGEDEKYCEGKTNLQTRRGVGVQFHIRADQNLQEVGMVHQWAPPTPIMRKRRAFKI